LRTHDNAILRNNLIGGIFSERDLKFV